MRILRAASKAKPDDRLIHVWYRDLKYCPNLPMKYQGNVYGAYESFWIVIDDTVWFVRAGGELFGPYKSKRAAQKAHNIKDVEKIKSGVYKCRDSSAHVQRRDRTRIPSSFDYNWPGLNDNS